MSKATDIAYFNDPSVSNSDIGLLKDSPWLFKQTKDKKIEKVTAAHFELGSLFHLSIFEPDLFIVASIDKPSGLMGVFIDRYVECGMNEEAAKEAYKVSGFKLPLKTVLAKLNEGDNKKYLEFIQTNNDKLLLTRQQKWTITQMGKGIDRNPTAKSLLLSSETNYFNLSDKDEYEVFNEIELYGVLEGVKIKGKIDKLIIDHKNKKITLVDLKSTSSAPYFRFKKVLNTGDLTIDYQGTGFFGSFKSWCYYRQLAFYKTLIAENYKNLFETYSFECYIIPVNTISSYDCSVIKVSDAWLEYGRLEMEDLIFRYKQHVKEDQWDYPIFDSNKGLIVL